MTSYNKKIVVLMAAIALCSGATALYSAQADTNDCAKTSFEAFDSKFDFQSNLSLPSKNDPGKSELTLRIMLTVLFTILLGVAAIYVSKKFLPRITKLSGKKIQVSETVYLGPRKAVHLIKIGEQTLLVGSTNENITKLADVTDALVKADLLTKNPNDK